jgi:hypothetical protein
MTKKERLDKIEQLTEELMIEFLESGATERLAELATPSNYLAKNSKVAEKEKSTINDEIKERVEAAKARRKKIV